MANVNSLTIGNTSLSVANSLASLSDVSTANTAEGNILTFDGTSWTNGTLTGNNGVSVSRTGANYTLSGDASWAKTQAIAAPLTGLDTSQGGAVTASDMVLSAIGKLAGPVHVATSSGTTLREHLASLMQYITVRGISSKRNSEMFLLGYARTSVFRVVSLFHEGAVFRCPCALGSTDVIVFIPTSTGNAGSAYVKSRDINSTQFADISEEPANYNFSIYM